MEGIDELLENPEDYRVGDNYGATNIVFPVEFTREENGKIKIIGKYIVKQPRKLALFNGGGQDKSLFRTRKWRSGKRGLDEEAQKLQILQGLKVPKLIAYDRGILVREFLDGTGFLETDDQGKTLEEALQTLETIHNRAVIVGDAHVKNIIRCKDGVYWFGFDGVFKEYFSKKPWEENGSKKYRSRLEKAKAIDLIKFVYSTYLVTENPNTLLYAAELVPRVYRDRQVTETVSNLVNNFPLSVLDEELDEKVRKILTVD